MTSSTPNHDEPEDSELRQDYPGGRPVGHRPSREREDDLRGHAREAQPYEEAPAEGHLAPDAPDAPPGEK